MSIHWIETQSDDVFATLDAIDQALATKNHGQIPGSAPSVSADMDPYLTESVASAHRHWSVDTGAVIMSNRPGIGRLIIALQRVIRLLTWWQYLPQWQQISQFHAAIVRIIDVLLDRQRLHHIRLGQLESANTAAHLFALEQQIQALRDEQRELRRRLAALEGTGEQ
jgi:hypothetical protein